MRQVFQLPTSFQNRHNIGLLRERIQCLVQNAVGKLQKPGDFPYTEKVPIEIIDPKNPEHGDFACNFALMASKAAGQPPRVIAEALKAALADRPEFSEIEVAGPGFLNFRLQPAFVADYVLTILSLGREGLATSEAANPLSINVEFVSVNPNGPITVGSGRGAAIGDSLCRILVAAGHTVAREYYINDGVNSEQMRLFGESVKALAEGRPVPENGYKGDYVQAVADMVKSKAPPGQLLDLEWYRGQAQSAMIERQKEDLLLFRVAFDLWFSEMSLHDEGKVAAALEHLRANGAADYEPYRTVIVPEGKTRTVTKTEEEPGPLWLRSTRFGDDKDRVLVRADGRPAYTAADVAYLRNKLGERGFDRSILLVGPDHHGYVGRLMAICEALGFAPEQFQIIVFQLVRFMKEGKPAPMRKRDGNIYELRDLVLELGESAGSHLGEAERAIAGADVARFFYLMRSPDSPLDFDIDLATKQGDENPVFYVQYAHARICSVLRKAEDEGFDVHGGFQPHLLSHPRELALVRRILELPEEVRRTAADYAVNRLTTYSIELARSFHHFYDACKVIQKEEAALTQARLGLCRAAQIGLQSVLDLIGISTPERMDRPAAS